MKSRNGKIIAFVLVALMVLCCSSDIGFLSAFAETGSVAVQENGSGNAGETAAPEQAEQQTTEAPEGEPAPEATEAPTEAAEPTEAEPAEPEATEPADADPTEATGQTEAAEEDAVREQEIKAEVVSDPLYKDGQKKHRTKGYRYLARFWKALMDRKDGAKDEELKPEVTVSGMLPEGARAECTVIAMEDPAVFTEQGLFSLELVLYDGAGEVYLPEEPVTVTVKGRSLKQEIGEGSGLLVYSWTEAEERAEKYSKKYGRDVYAADALVRKSRSVDDELLKYEPYSKGKTYEDGEDAVRFSEKEEILDCGSDSVTFDVSYGEEADPSGAGHFAFTAQVKERTLKKKSGNARITVTGPLDRAATLEVSELAKKDSEYKDYVKKTAETLDKEASEFSFARAFDIRLIDPANGEEFQPEDGVKVSIDLQDEEIGDEENVDVVHFAETENKGKTVETPEVMDAKTDGGEVAFATDGFSVYVVVGSGGEIVTHTWTYRFFIPKEGVDPGEQDMGDYYLVAGWPAKYDPVPVSTDSGETSAQTIKGGEKPVVPQQPEPEGKSFAGWYRGEPEGESDLRLSKTAYDFNAIPKTLEDDQTIDIFARYSDEYTVYFHDQYNGNLEDYPISSSRRGEISGNTAEVKISDVSAVYSGGSDMGFYGWSEEPIREQGKEADKDKKITTDTITIDGNKDLYPIFQPIHWLTYYSAEAGSGATYVPTRSFFAEDYEESLEVPVWAGHTFQGWYTGSLDGDRVTYSTQITDENGAIVNFPDTPGLERRSGRLYVTGDTTLYARWSDETTVDYKIIIWKQKTTDEPGLPNSRKSYDLYESVIKTVPTGSTATVDAEYKAYATDGAHPELTGYDCRSDADVPVNPQGYTVLNVYYDRNGAYVPSGSPHALIFDDSSDDRAAGLPVNYMGADAVEYGTSLLTGNQGGSYVPAEPTKDNYTFTGWFADKNCTTRVFFDQESLDAYTGHDQTMLCDTMPDEALTLYAGWESDWYLVQVDPNYGTFNGSGGTWFWETFDGDLVQEYTQTTRDYVESSSGQYYYVKKDRAYYGYSGYEWDQSEPDRQTSYTTDPSEATEDGTFEKAPGVYSYAGWYEVKADGSEVPYDFSKHVDHHTTIKLHWKRSGVYYVSYNTKVTEGSQTLEGELSGSQDTTAYCDDADVQVTCSAIPPSGYTFSGWKIRGDDSGRIYSPSQTFKLPADLSVTVSGKKTVFLDAVYVKAGMARVVYDANGGSIDPDGVDYGSCKDGTPITGSVAADRKTATAAGIPNNAEFTLSDGSGFVHPRQDVQFLGWSNKEVYDPNDSDAVFYEAGVSDRYGVDKEAPDRLYAVWGVKVTYHKNNTSASAKWSETGDAWEDPYVSEETPSGEQVYTRYAYLGAPVDRPEYTPTFTGGSQVFYNWRTNAHPTGHASGDDDIYDFSTPVTEPLDLYAYWDDPSACGVHAVDASASTLVERTDSDTGWTVPRIIDVETTATRLDNWQEANITAPGGYTYAFAAVHDDPDDLQGISEDKAAAAIKYDSKGNAVAVKYEGDSSYTALKTGEEIYFIYYKARSLDIGYKSMADSGELTAVTGVDPDAPVSTGAIPGAITPEYNMASDVYAPLGWTSHRYSFFAYAIGDADAPDASALSFLTDSSASDSSLPKLKIRNTWKGFQYSSDNGKSWTSCGYEPQLYAIYFEKKPTVVMFNETTVGSDAVMGTEFAYNVVVTEKTGDGDPTTIYDTGSSPYVLKNGEAQSAILFYSKAGSTETTQTITITQDENTAFKTTVSEDSGSPAEGRTWTYTSSAGGGTKEVAFTNEHKSLPVEVHVAIADASGYTLRDDLRSTRADHYSFDLPIRDSRTLTSELDPDDVFVGGTGFDPDDYTFGAVICGTNGSGDRPAIDAESLAVSDVSYGQVGKDRDNLYELMLQDSGASDWYELGSSRIYYLYYQMPRISYVKEKSDGTLENVQGSLDGSSVTDDITYNGDHLNMNGQRVVQDQGLAVPLSGLLITQNGSKNDFRMPSILDDGIHHRYLQYAKIGAGQDGIDTIGGLGSDVSDGQKLYLKVMDNKLKFSFDNTSWKAFPEGSVPTIYAVYEDRGYDLQITKTVPNLSEVGGDPKFTLEISSEAITKPSYEIQGYSEATIDSQPAGGSKRKIQLEIRDGTDVKIIGLGQGDYDIRETGSRNFSLSAESRAISGGDPVTLTVTDSDDRTVHTTSMSLNEERRLALANHPRPICKIVNGGREIIFYSLQSAVEYIRQELTTTETIQMLTDYDMPATDAPVIPSGYSITLTTAATEGGQYNYDGEGSTAIITRARDNADQYLISNNNGTLTLDNLIFDGKSLQASKALVHSTGTLILTDVSMENGKNSGNGGTIYAESGSVTLTNSTFANNTADKGGAIYSTGNGIAVKTEGSGKSTFTGNSAGSGGAIYYDGDASGVIDLSGSTTLGGNTMAKGNKATSGNGGAIYATSGTINVGSGVALSGNAANAGLGGAIYTGDGEVNIPGGSIGEDCRNTAKNGAAVFVDTGSVNISGGRITGNEASEGGAIGVGSTSARLNFSGKAYVTGNTNSAGDDCNVYLDQDTDTVINATGLSADSGGVPVIGVYAPDDSDLFDHRGKPGCSFGHYTDETNLTAFKNDRLPNLTAHAETVSRRIIWGKSIQVQVRYMETYTENGFPQKSGGNWNGTKKYPTSGNWIEYNLPSNDNRVSAIADDLRSRYSLGLTNTAAFACAFLDDGENAIGYGKYLTDVNWVTDDWQFVGRDGSVSAGDKLVIYFAEPAYISIENNTTFNLDHSDLTMLGYHAANSATQVGYGYIYAINGKVQDSLVPITAEQLKLNKGRSIKLIFPGGTGKTAGKPYTLSGGFAVGSSEDPIPVTQDGVPDIQPLTGNEREAFSLDQGKTAAGFGSTVKIIFGGDRPICKIVTSQPVPGASAGEYVGIDEDDEDGIAYLFAKLTDAVAFATAHGTAFPELKEATVELLVDYMIPGSDVVNNIPAGYDLTFTTAIGDTEDDYNYSDDPADRATISRDTSNTDSFFKLTGGNLSTLTVQNLIFDRKDYAGSNDGGLIATKDFNVVIDNTDFLNSTASNGGGIYIDYTPSGSGGTLTVTNSKFENCHSSGTNRKGGGAIWTTARVMTVTNTTFDNCTGTDQGGAIFHRIDTQKYTPQAYATDSTSVITGCTFETCKSRSGGAVESDAHHITFDGCSFTECESKIMTGSNTGSGGAINTYIYEGNGALGRTYPTYLTVRNSTFTNCRTTAGDGNTRGHGGGIRTTSLTNVIENCTFTGCEARYNGGAICINNNEAISATITGCTITGSKAVSGGGIYVKTDNKRTDPPMMLTIEGGTISDNNAESQGGGVWTNSAMTIRNDAQITGNRLLSANVANAAGVFIDNKTLVIGTTGATEEDMSSITRNTVSGGIASNLRMWSGNNVASVSVLSDMGGKIGVVNPGAIRTQFGSAPNATPERRPHGLSDDDHTFVADDGSTYGIIDRSDPQGKKIIWAAPPICKITDVNGDILYLDADLKYPAIFDQLDNSNHGDDGGWSAAFACLRNPTLYDKNGNAYPKSDASKPFRVEMLVENYEIKNYVTTKNNAANRTIIVTTAQPKNKCKDDYPYRGSAGTYATLVKSRNIAASNMFTARYNLTFENITLDGGYNPSSPSTSVTTTIDGGLIDVREPAGVTVTLGNNATLQNTYTTKNGGAVVVKNGRLVIKGNASITNCSAVGNGGAVYLTTVNNSTATLEMSGGTIKGCSGASGGAVYADNSRGGVAMSGGRIQDCTAATGNGGAVYQKQGSFAMTGGTITGCDAVNGSGGGVFVANGMTFTMSNAFITNNHAKNAGGGIAVGGNASRLVFSGAPYVSGNKSDASVARDKTCNLELSYGFSYRSPETPQHPETVIRSNRLNAGARIGVYVPNSNNLYTNHGDEGDPFGTFTNPSEVGTLYGFINDRNGLKGGLGSGQDPSNNYMIYWIKIFSLEVEKTVDSYGQYVEEDNAKTFRFRVTLSGQGDDGTYAERITTPDDDPDKYGAMKFNRGVAEFTLKAGDPPMIGERLPSGLMYEVEEIMNDDQKKVFTALPLGTVQEGMIGEHAESTDENRYVSHIDFVNMRPVCKITEKTAENDESGAVLYYPVNYQKIRVGANGRAVRDSAGNLQYDTRTKYLPAVYKRLSDAFGAIQSSGQALYFKRGSSYSAYNSGYYYNVKMLASSYTMTQALSVNSGKKIALTTAGLNESEFPRQFAGDTPSIIRRGGFTGSSMFTAIGEFRLKSITLDGNKTNYTATVNGGIVNVPSGGVLKLRDGSTLRNSRTTGDGGAVYVASGGRLYLSGNLSFGGKGTYNNGSINSTVGNYSTGVDLPSDAKNGGQDYSSARQDIYIAEDAPPETVIVDGRITSGDGTIWVWAKQHGMSRKGDWFARLADGATAGNLKAFRNARPDAYTENDTGDYLYGTLIGEPPNGSTGISYIYWNDISGSYRVILRKVDGGYDPMDEVFKICHKGSETAITVRVGDETVTLSNLRCDDSGVFWIGDLPYGTYDVVETSTNPNRKFTLEVTENGINYEDGKQHREVHPN